MNYINYAVPFFVLAVACEFVFGWMTRRNTYALADTINSLQLGMLSRLRGLVQLGLIGIAFGALTENISLFKLDTGQWWVWVLAFIGYDLGYYFSHRYGHEWRILWASHVVHHQSEQYNLSTALRQTSTGWLNSIFYLPLYFLGMPVEVMISVGSLNLIYQFWVHTEHVGELGVLERILVTPSNHRVHHAKNPHYIDKNYGGVFIIWDRLFGTYQPELVEDPCRFGITRQLNSWNPVWANIHAWVDTAHQSWHTPRISDKLKVWFKSPAWDAPGVPSREADWQAPKFAPRISRYAAATSFIQFWLHIGAAFVLLDAAADLTQVMVLATAAWLTYGFCVQGLVMEARLLAAWYEWLRIGLGAGVLAILPVAELHTQLGVAYLLACVAINLGLPKTTLSADRLQSPG
jgi:sterol desaturase/sphingolipid hydroxylase (fatty acid hydroxylase superfamily)